MVERLDKGRGGKPLNRRVVLTVWFRNTYEVHFYNRNVTIVVLMTDRVFSRVIYKQFSYLLSDMLRKWDFYCRSYKIFLLHLQWYFKWFRFLMLVGFLLTLTSDDSFGVLLWRGLSNNRDNLSCTENSVFHSPVYRWTVSSRVMMCKKIFFKSRTTRNKWIFTHSG